LNSSLTSFTLSIALLSASSVFSSVCNNSIIFCLIRDHISAAACEHRLFAIISRYDKYLLRFQVDICYFQILAASKMLSSTASQGLIPVLR
ncbi:hypothetical protein, partial [Chitinophaga pinensis]|uniref:hypothetical protein n=1 Tax=Chitinophaga pinensis TaxID=79329 RepID=UPI001C99B70B